MWAACFGLLLNGVKQNFLTLPTPLKILVYTNLHAVWIVVGQIIVAGHTMHPWLARPVPACSHAAVYIAPNNTYGCHRILGNIPS